MSNKGVSPSEILAIYGLTLMICGALAFYASGYQAKAKSSLYMGNGGAAVSFALAAGARNIRLQKGDRGYMLMMVCIHIALVFPVLMAGVVSWRLALAWQVPAKAYLRPYLIAIIVSSLITTAVLSTFKPRKNAKQKGAVPAQDTDSISTAVDANATDSASYVESVTPNGVVDSQAGSSLCVAKPSRKGNHSTTDKSQKQHVVRRRPRRATAM